MRRLQSGLSLPEAIGLSLSIIAPTITAAFNITLAVQAAGPAAPLTFAIGTVGLSLVALSFVAFTRRVAHAGAAYAYITHTFGSRIGFVAGWTLLLSYLGFTTGFAALVGSFFAAVLRRLGVDIGPLWILVGALSIVLAWALTYRDMKRASRLMLGLEAVAVLAILGLCIRILTQTHPDLAQISDSFRPSADYGGWSGVGYGLVFTVLSFAGFEGAATLGEETRNPRRNIPIAIFGTVIGAGIFYVFVSLCEVIGFGPDHLTDLANSEAPLNDLAMRYGSADLAMLLDLATATSAFSGIMGGLAATGRVLFALGRVGLAPRLAGIHPRHGTPAPAITATAILIILPFLLWAPFAGAGHYYAYVSTIGTLALMLIYIGVGSAETIEAWREKREVWAGACVLGPALLIWVLYHTITPVPDFPNNLWPYLTLIWVVLAIPLLRWRPAMARAALPDYR